MANLDNLLEFISFTHDIQRVKRAMFVKGEDTYENDSEHSYQIAMAAFYIIETNQLALDVYHVMALALVHDIIEVYAGDTPVYGSHEALASKAEREAAAVKQLQDRWPQLTLLHELVAECEARVTPESKFVYALDKLVPMLNNYLDEGRSWRRQGVSFEQMLAVKRGKVDIDPTIAEYYQAIVEVLREHPEVFGDSPHEG
jgi:putative hydrolase of HD superfamily